MLKKILIGLAVIIVVFVVVVAMQPADYKVERTASFSAAPAVVFDQINDLRKWDAWSPWAKLDPGMAISIAMPTARQWIVFLMTSSNNETWAHRDRKRPMIPDNFEV